MLVKTLDDPPLFVGHGLVLPNYTMSGDSYSYYELVRNSINSVREQKAADDCYRVIVLIVFLEHSLSSCGVKNSVRRGSIAAQSARVLFVYYNYCYSCGLYKTETF